jgi:hypothetical protein
MKIYDVKASTISWIDKDLMSGFSSMPSFGSDWLDFLCYGMYHTANPTPPKYFDEKYESGKTLSRQYRSLTIFAIQLQLDDSGNFLSVRRLPGSDAVLDAGYTPPFDSGWELAKGLGGAAFTGQDPTLPPRMKEEATSYNPGEKSSLSQIVLPGADWQNRGITPLDYSTIKVNPGEVILGHSLIKFRVGARGDYIAIVGMMTPAHMPWVWCEAIVAYKDNNLILYAAGSAFPCHAFYMAGRQLARLDLTTNLSSLRDVFTRGLPAKIKWGHMWGQPTLVVDSINDQTPTTETNKSGKNVAEQPYDSPANAKGVIRAVLPLWPPE